MRAASRDENAFFTVLLKVPGLNAILYLQLLQMLAAQVEGLHQDTNLQAFLQTINSFEVYDRAVCEGAAVVDPRALIFEETCHHKQFRDLSHKWPALIAPPRQDKKNHVCIRTACSRQNKPTSLVCNSKGKGDAAASSEFLARLTHGDL